ncbi:hypothetical protein C1H46_016989 [Malus baccata]|uniref:Uncharacterized protein n=1 Tax=Malus baccata TaxID=106549 RepID=A0A540MF96_MALBA|nr:hypothetical protein C1H46_016989 [Malus baccata]
MLQSNPQLGPNEEEKGVNNTKLALGKLPLSSIKVHKYGKSTTGESWDIVVDEETYYEAELSIKPLERPPGVYPALDFGSSSPSVDEPSDEFSPISIRLEKGFNFNVCMCYYSPLIVKNQD